MEAMTPAPAPGGQSFFRPVRGGNAFEQTLERLLQVIKLGIVRHGERLPSERDLVEQLSVSRATLREALRFLQSEGYVEARRGRTGGGTYVTYRPTEAVGPRPRAADAAAREDLLGFRRVLEAGASELAAQRGLSSEERAYLQERFDATINAPPAEYRQMDSRFHLAIAELSGSPSLASALADNRMRLNELLDCFPMVDKNLAHAEAQHRRIFKAILAGDPAAARRAMLGHVDGTAALIRGFLADP